MNKNLLGLRILLIAVIAWLGYLAFYANNIIVSSQRSLEFGQTTITELLPKDLRVYTISFNDNEKNSFGFKEVNVFGTLNKECKHYKITMPIIRYFTSAKIEELISDVSCLTGSFKFETNGKVGATDLTKLEKITNKALDAVKQVEGEENGIHSIRVYVDQKETEEMYVLEIYGKKVSEKESSSTKTVYYKGYQVVFLGANLDQYQILPIE